MGWGLLRILSALMSFLHCRVISHLAQALAASRFSATKKRCGKGSKVDPLMTNKRHKFYIRGGGWRHVTKSRSFAGGQGVTRRKGDGGMHIALQ